MFPETPSQLATRKCALCEGGLPKYTRFEAEEQLAALEGWHLVHDSQRIR
jgi:hypothetical protein